MIKIEVGKAYLNCLGSVVYITGFELNTHRTGFDYLSDDGFWYREDGRYLESHECTGDLVKEAVQLDIGLHCFLTDLNMEED